MADRVFLWTSPRSLSAAVEKCVAHMDGSMVWHEPYTSVFFNRVTKNPETFVKFPKMKTFAAEFEAAAKTVDTVKDQYAGGNLGRSEDFTFEYVKTQLEKPLDKGKKFMFIKDMAMGIDGNYKFLPKGGFKHTFLIRDPSRAAHSAMKLLADLFKFKGNLDDFTDIGANPFMSWDMLSVDPVYNLYKYVKKNIDPNPIVIDADDLQNHPDIILKKYCVAVNVPWDDKYLTWSGSDEYMKYFHGTIEEIVWAKKEDLYKVAVESTKILPITSKPPAKLTSSCEKYAQEFRAGYKIMYEHRIKPE